MYFIEVLNKFMFKEQRKIIVYLKIKINGDKN